MGLSHAKRYSQREVKYSPRVTFQDQDNFENLVKGVPLWDRRDACPTRG